MKAFPNHRSEGMDLRDYFAAEAMKELIKIFNVDKTINDPNQRRLSVSTAAYLQADAMMKARGQL
jgi:hypothetical protein